MFNRITLCGRAKRTQWNTLR